MNTRWGIRKPIMGLTVTPIPLLKDNYAYLLAEDGHAVLIDPSEGEPVLNVLREKGVALDAIWCTHHHGDHIGGVEAIHVETACEVIASDTDKQRIPCVTMAFHDNEAFHWHGHRVEVMHIPGHTQGAIAYYLPNDNLIFTGDTLFSVGCGRTLEGTMAQLFHSLLRLSSLPEQVLIYAGHEYTMKNIEFALTIEPDNDVLQSHAETVRILQSRKLCTYPSSVGFENAINPFLRTYLPVMRRTLGLGSDASDLDVFIELRTRKDHF